MSSIWTITRECTSKGMNYHFVQLGVERGEILLEKDKSIAYSVKEGVAMVAEQHRLANFRNRTLGNQVVYYSYVS